MTACTACGHDPLTGRYCSDCGAPAGAGIPTAAPTPVGMPPPARFPLYADDAPSGPTTSTDSSPPEKPLPETAIQPAAPDSPPSPDDVNEAVSHTRPRPTTWQIGIGLVVLLALLGTGLMLFGGGDGEEEAVATDPATATNDSPSSEEDAAPAPPPAGRRLAPAEIDVPGTAKPSQDNDGNPVTYDAGNLFDEDPRTAWRVAGDATGSVLTLRFEEPVTVKDVGLINGYAKEDPPNDWYAANRRVLAVEWTFDDGTTITQDLTDEREVQRMQIDAVETDVVELRLVEVGEPGGRDYTAISEITLSGDR